MKLALDVPREDALSFTEFERVPPIGAKIKAHGYEYEVMAVRPWIQEWKGKGKPPYATVFLQ